MIIDELNNIKAEKGLPFTLNVNIYNEDGTAREWVDGDSIWFGIKKPGSVDIGTNGTFSQPVINLNETTMSVQPIGLREYEIVLIPKDGIKTSIASGTFEVTDGVYWTR